jgi:hypothetical protein
VANHLSLKPNKNHLEEKFQNFRKQVKNIHLDLAEDQFLIANFNFIAKSLADFNLIQISNIINLLTNEINSHDMKTKTSMNKIFQTLSQAPSNIYFSNSFSTLLDEFKFLTKTYYFTAWEISLSDIFNENFRILNQNVLLPNYGDDFHNQYTSPIP